ncbi:MAG: ATP-binding cassette domain-containing protein [candidate division Zixibacteria bacterium]|nr:ATP-binding cassette domain-containing protein [candidate division Zixibacteria bacterium]
MSVSLELHNVSFQYGDSLPLLSNLSFCLEEGEVLWLTGAASCGKSTLVRIILREETPNSGSGSVLGKSLFGPNGYDQRQLRQDIGLILERNLFLPHIDVAGNVAAPLLVKGLSRRRIGRRVKEALRQVGLTGKARASVSELSKTERRLLTLATALAKKPPLIIADLNPDDIDRGYLVPRLLESAAYGSAVLLLAQSRWGEGREYSLSGGTRVAAFV